MSKDLRMRFGYILPNLISPIANAEALKTTARLAEDIGFDSMWTTDHILMPVEHPQYGEGTEAIATLSFLAGMTERIGLGISVLVLPMRNPVIVAKELASLAHLAGREFILGVGVGWNEQEYGYLNADFHGRGKLLDEYVEILKTLWTHEHPVFDGTFKFSGATFSPMLNPPPKIWVGGESAAAIQRAARIGDGYHPNYREHTDYAAVVREIRATNGGRPMTMSVRITLDLQNGAGAAIEKLGKMREDGLEYPVVGFKHTTLDEMVKAMELFGREVMPALRG